MFVRCIIKTVLEHPIDTLINISRVDVIEKRIDTHTVFVIFNDGHFEFRMSTAQETECLFNAFSLLLSRRKDVELPGIKLLTL